MALATTAFKNDLKEAFKAARNPDDTEEEALERFCDKMATALEKYIKTAKVAYTTGLVAGNVPVTGTLTHTIQ